MDEQPNIPLDLQRRIEQRWTARFAREQQLKDRRFEMPGRSERRRLHLLRKQPTHFRGAA
jgi:hypothetical protein